MSNELKPCPFCHQSWLYASTGDYGSGYEAHGYRVECRCGFAWKAITWQKTKQEAIEEWNKVVNNDKRTEKTIQESL